MRRAEAGEGALEVFIANIYGGKTISTVPARVRKFKKHCGETVESGLLNESVRSHVAVKTQAYALKRV